MATEYGPKYLVTKVLRLLVFNPVPSAQQPDALPLYHGLPSDPCWGEDG